MNLILENIQNAKALLKKHNIPEDNREFLLIKDMLSKKVGWVYWYTKLRFVYEIPFNALHALYNYLEQNKNLVSKLGDITKYDDVEKIYDDVEKLKLKQEILNLYNQFPKKQKDLIKIDTDSDLLKALYDRKDVKDFLIKIARYKTRKDLIEGIKF